MKTNVPTARRDQLRFLSATLWLILVVGYIFFEGLITILGKMIHAFMTEGQIFSVCLWLGFCGLTTNELLYFLSEIKSNRIRKARLAEFRQTAEKN